MRDCCLALHSVHWLELLHLVRLVASKHGQRLSYLLVTDSGGLHVRNSGRVIAIRRSGETSIAKLLLFWVGIHSGVGLLAVPEVQERVLLALDHRLPLVVAFAVL